MATARKSARKTVRRTGVTKDAYVKRPSQITRKTPTKRLVKRRVKKVASPKVTKGFFPNPLKPSFNYRVQIMPLGETVFETIATFKRVNHAKQYVVAYAKSYPKDIVRLVDGET